MRYATVPGVGYKVEIHLGTVSTASTDSSHVWNVYHEDQSKSGVRHGAHGGRVYGYSANKKVHSCTNNVAQNKYTN